MLGGHYSDGVRFTVDGTPIRPAVDGAERGALSIRLARKRRPSAVGYLVRVGASLPEELQGLAVSTLGKVIKRGWDWLGLSPAAPDRVSGLIEVPALAGCLTLNKADFIRAGARGAIYLAHRKAIQEAVAAQLAAWGDSRENAVEEEARRRKTRPVERDLAEVLAEMAEDFPLVASLVERRAGGQKRLPMAGGNGRLGMVAAPARLAELAGNGGEGLETQTREEPPPANEAPESSGEDGADGPEGSASVSWPALRGRRRPSRLGLTIQFESRPDDTQLGRLVESTVWINDAHPAYRRAAASRAEAYHLALTVAMALAPLAADAAEAHRFVTAFLARWGEALDHPVPRRRQRRSGKTG